MGTARPSGCIFGSLRRPARNFYGKNSRITAVLRHPGTGKWFGTLISLPRSRLKLSGSGAVEIINLKCGPHLTGALIDGRRYLPAYHMNKEHWVAVLLDGTVAAEEICRLADLSFALVAGTLS